MCKEAICLSYFMLKGIHTLTARWYWNELIKLISNPVFREDTRKGKPFLIKSLII